MKRVPDIRLDLLSLRFEGKPLVTTCVKNSQVQKEYKNRQDWMGKMIHWDHLSNHMRLKFYHTNKWNMQKPESTLENEMHKILGNFEI